MVFNIAVIVVLVVQGAIICWLANTATEMGTAFFGLFVYFQRLAMDLGYPKLMNVDDDDEDEVKQWSESRKK